MAISLKGKTAIVTGAAVGIGPAYARALTAEGVDVAVCDIRQEIMDLPAQLETNGVKAFAMVADVSRPEDVREFVDSTIGALGGIDILINNAGKCKVSLAEDGLDKTLDDYEEMVGTNLKGEFLMGRAVIAQMLKQDRGGEIVNIATDHMFTCGAPHDQCPKNPNCPWADAPRPTSGGHVMDIYDASKWGLNGLMFAWAQALKPHSVRVNGICMGATDSWMIRDFFRFPQNSAEETDEQKKEIATWMAKDDVAQVVIDLLKEGPGGRNANNINLCVGRPPKLEPPLPLLYIKEEALHGDA